MNQNFTIFSLFFLATALVSFFVALLAWQRRNVKGAAELTRLMIAAGIWAFLVMFETASHSMAGKIFWAKMAYFGAVASPALYLIFVLRFTGRDKFFSRKYFLSLFIIPFITLVLAVTNEKHSLIWSGFSAISEKTNLMEYYHGIGFWIGYMAYNNLLLLFATFYLFSFILYHIKMFRMQGWVVLVAGLCPWIASAIYLTGNNPVEGLDLVPVSIILSGALLVYAILYIRFLDLAPVARKTLVETLPDGILAIDDQNRIQDINAAALSFLGIRNEKILGLAIGSCGASVIPLLNATVDQESFDQLEIGTENGIKTYRILKKGIKNQPGSRLVVIRDISDQVARQKEIRAVEERYRSMFTMFRLMADNMPDMLWAKDLDKNFIFANKAVCENLIGALNTDEPFGKNDLFFAERERKKHPERSDWYTFGELCQDSDQVVLNSMKPERFDEFGNVKGEFLFLDVRKAPIFNETGV
ncbi:MAG: histidine kinase N-terminal 7TM domain-containing protein, partial [Bacteroidota bacterium]